MKVKDMPYEHLPIEEIRAEDACLSLRTLAVGGDDLMALGIPKGKQIGQMLQTLLDEVIEERLPNEKGALLQAAKELSEPRKNTELL